ncbi:MAG: hypothetical protein HY305_02115 [Sphingobacteriales bacterium]|nr:hypothetical protein [Sphingobacteriales bacterium]
MQFENIIGQKEVKKQLTEMIQHNRLSHALLFLGKEGSGALSLAMAFAQYIVCENANGKKPASAGALFGEPEPVNNELLSDSCGICPACTKANQLVHPDIHFSYPVIPRKAGDKPISTDYIIEWREFISLHPYTNAYDWLQFIGAENKQGNITAHECNDIIRKLNLKSFESEYKILIMWLPEFLGKEGNKLLKLIEEPPPNTLFLLVAENEDQILQTILSRTQLVKIPRLTNSEVEEEISKQGREKQKQFLKYFTHLLEQAIRLKVIETNAQGSFANAEQDFALRLNKLCTISQQEAIINELDQASYYIERNANAKMLFHALSIKLYHIISNNSLILIN